MLLMCTGFIGLLGHDMSSQIPSFWVVILTDGEDTSSKQSLEQACAIINRVDRELGQLNLCRVMLIGVDLSGTALSNMQRLAASGGRSAVFENLRDANSIRTKFREISLQISSLSLVNPQADARIHAQQNAERLAQENAARLQQALQQEVTLSRSVFDF